METRPRAYSKRWSHFAARDWDALAQLVANNYSRSITEGRESQINMVEKLWSRICKRPPTSASRYRC